MSELRVIVLGGYGFFGRRLVRRLTRIPGIHLRIAGRSPASAQALVDHIGHTPSGRIEACALDAEDPFLPDTLRRLRPAVLVNASGPFRSADYRVPAACIAAGIHYADLADHRGYVAGITCLHGAALAAGVTVVAGASSVPGLSSAVVDRLANDLPTLETIDIGISPGNRTERGLATVRSILRDCGKPLPGSTGAQTFTWTGTREHCYPAPVGKRLLSPCDVPDLTLLATRYAGQPEVRFGAGLELRFLHRGMTLLAWMARRHLVQDWSRHAVLLKRAADIFRHWGSDAGAMHVSVRGRDRADAAVTRTWQLVAAEGDGPFVPTLAATAFVRGLRDRGFPHGAFPCVGLLSLEDILQEAEGLAIRTETRV